MPLIRCTCGAEILLIPDINEMNNAIINHIKEHKNMALSNGKRGITPSQIERILVAQILTKASEQHWRCRPKKTKREEAGVDITTRSRAEFDNRTKKRKKEKATSDWFSRRKKGISSWKHRQFTRNYPTQAASLMENALISATLCGLSATKHKWPKKRKGDKVFWSINVLRWWRVRGDLNPCPSAFFRE